MAIADAIVRDSINKDGASRRFLLREGFLDLPVIEEEKKAEEKELNISEEKRWELQSLLVDVINDKTRT